MKSSGISEKAVYGLVVSILVVLAASVCVCAAQEQGELQLPGTHVRRLVLVTDDGRTMKWTQPAGRVVLPLGTYRVQELTLRGDLAVDHPRALGKITITKDAPAVLKAGGPLRQTIDVRRQGRVLVLNYRLTGLGDESYLPPRRPEQRGRFTAYRGRKVIGRGAFEYG